MSSEYLRVFLSYGSEDEITVRNIYLRLREDGVQPWFDKENLLPGQDWNLEIREAVKSSDAILVCLSSESVRKEGYVQKEIKYALDMAEEKPEGTIFIIPIKLNSCELPSRLQSWHWVDWSNPGAVEKIIQSLRTRAAELGIDHLPGSGPLVRIVNPLNDAETRIVCKATDIRELVTKSRGGYLIASDVPVHPSEQVVAITEEALSELLSPYGSDERRSNVKEGVLALIGIRSPYREWQEVNTRNYCFRNDPKHSPVSVLIQRTPVRSSNISTIGYDIQSQILEVEFRSGAIYHYFSVPEHLFHGLMSASSHGKYLNNCIKFGYAYEQI